MNVAEQNAINRVGNAALDDIAWSVAHSPTIETWLEDNYGGSGNLFKSSFALIISIFILIKIIV